MGPTMFNTDCSSCVTLHGKCLGLNVLLCDDIVARASDPLGKALQASCQFSKWLYNAWMSVM